jgi:PAS domain S-box-containing protein
MKGERVSIRSVLPRPGAPPVTVDINSTTIYRGERRYVFSIMRDVSEQVKTEEELRRSREDLERHVAERTAQLRESEERFRGAFAQGGIGLAIVRPDGRPLQVNRSLCEMLGYEERDLLATTFPALTHPEDLQSNLEGFRDLIEGKFSSLRLEKRYIHRKGHVVWVDLSSTPIHDSGGKPLYFVTTIQEITERKRAEEELRQSEARFRSITEATPLPVTITRPDGEVLYVNEAASRLFRLGSEGTQGRNASEFYADPADRLAMKEQIQKEGTVSGMELMFRRADGTLFWTVVNLRLLTFEGGPAILGTFVDIDERKRSEEALRESEVRFRAITEGVPVAVVIARASDGGILYANETAADSLGLASGAVEGRTVGEFLARPRDREEIQTRLMRDGFVRDLELQFRKVDGARFWVITSLRLATYKGERATLGVFSDITDRKKAEELLRKAHEELELRVVERTAELARANALLQEEIAERKRAENTLRVIVEGTAAVTGGSFFRSLARHLASALNVRYALVVQGIGRPPRRARTIAFWNGSDFADPLEYDIQGTPCEDVLGGEACCYSHDVQRLFPDFKVLGELDVESYLGVPIADSTGTVVGQLVVMDLEPVSDVELKLSVLKIFAARAGVELERQLAEEALRESEERWRSLVANAPDIITTVDREGRILSINRLIGRRLEDVIGRPVYGFVPPGFVERVRTAIDTVFREGRSVSYETLSGGPNGASAWYSSRVGPVVLDGRVAAATIISTDITERWKAEQRQKVQHEVTQILAEAASLEEAVPRLIQRVCEVLDWKIGLLWRIDAAANVLRLADFYRPSNPAARALMESTGDFSFAPGIGLPGRVWKDRSSHWIPDVTQDANFPRRPAATKAGMHAAFAAPVEGPQGTFGVIEFLSSEIRERDEPLLQVVTTLGSQLGQFIERKRAEEDLRFQKSLLESQSEAAIDGILVVSRDGVMTSFNRRFCQMWEIPDEVLRSRTDEGALKSVLDKLKDPKEFLARVRYLYDHPDQESRDEIHLKDGRAFDRYSAPVKGADGELYGRVWYFRDVTGRKQTEENLRRAATETRQMYENLKEAQAQLIRSEKLASIGMLVSGVAHEINNPLNVMYGNLQLLAEVSDVLLPLSVAGAKSKKVRGTVGKVAKFRGMIRDALKAARHAREIVQDFRNFARDTRTAELVDLNQCLEEAVTLIQRELRPGIRVVRKLGRIPQVRCLRGQMSQVFLNLLKNAGEAIERKGTVTLRTKQKNGQVLVEVADTGRGMPEEIRRKLFEPFFTTKPVGKGLGLGLSISAMIVHNHNGNIAVSSQPGKGSVFRVTLPLPL